MRNVCVTYVVRGNIVPVSEDTVVTVCGAEFCGVCEKGTFSKLCLISPGDEYDRLTVISPKLRRVFKTEKAGVVDLKLNTKSGKIIHIELQVEKRSNMRNRILYYGSRLIGDQLKLGDDYHNLHQAISIVICDHNLLEEEDSYFNVYELRNEENSSFTKLLRIIILELPKLPETA